MSTRLDVALSDGHHNQAVCAYEQHSMPYAPKKTTPRGGSHHSTKQVQSAPWSFCLWDLSFQRLKNCIVLSVANRQMTDIRTQIGTTKIALHASPELRPACQLVVVIRQEKRGYSGRSLYRACDSLQQTISRLYRQAGIAGVIAQRAALPSS